MGGTGIGWRPEPGQQAEGVAIRQFDSNARIEVYFRYRGVRCRECLKALEVTRPNYAYAVRLRGEILNAISRGTFRYGDYFPDSKRAAIFGHAVSKSLMGDLIDDHIKRCAETVERGNMSPGTLRVYRGIGSKLKDSIGKVRAVDLTAGHIKQLIAQQACTAKTIRNLLSVLRIVIDEAIEDGLINANPFAGVAVRRAIKKVAVKSDWVVDPFTLEERKAFMGACPTDEERDMFTFWFETGLRPGELIAFEWDKFDGVHNKVRIDAAVAERIEKGPKTEAGIRDVELNDAALAALERQRARTFLAGGRVWRSPKFEAPWVDDAQLRRSSYRVIARKAKIRWRNMYQIRHTYASTHCSQGANPYWLATQMGHKTIEVIVRHYGRWIEGFKKQTVGRDGRPVSEPAVHAVSTQKVVSIKSG